MRVIDFRHHVVETEITEVIINSVCALLDFIGEFAFAPFFLHEEVTIELFDDSRQTVEDFRSFIVENVGAKNEYREAQS